MSSDGPPGNYCGVLNEHLIGHVLRDKMEGLHIPTSNMRDNIIKGKIKYNYWVLETFYVFPFFVFTP